LVLQQTLIFMQNCQNEIGTDVRNEKVQKKQKEEGCAKERKKENKARINYMWKNVEVEGDDGSVLPMG
jgi:hypothetical protein